MKLTKATLRKLIKEEIEEMQQEEATLSEEVALDGGAIEEIKNLAYKLYQATMNLPTSARGQAQMDQDMKNLHRR